MHTTTVSMDSLNTPWRFSKLAYSPSLPHRRANCLNFAESHRLYGTETQIENQRRTFLINSRQETKQFLRKHNYNSPETYPQILHYQNLPPSSIGNRRLAGVSYFGDDVSELSAPRSSPVSSTNDYLPESVYAHLNARCAELDGAIKNLTKVAIEHLKQNKEKVLTIGKSQALKAELHERNRKYLHHPMRQSLTKVTFDGTPGVTISLPLQRAKTLPENILKLVQSTTDVPQTRFRYQKSASHTENNLMKSRPSSYKVAYHKEKEKFRVKHSGTFIDMDNRKLSSTRCIKYGDFGCSSSQGHRKSCGSVEMENKQSRMFLRTAPSKSKKHSFCALPQILTGASNRTDGEQMNQLYDRWSRTKSLKLEKARTASFPAIGDKSYRH